MSYTPDKYLMPEDQKRLNKARSEAIGSAINWGQYIKPRNIGNPIHIVDKVVWREE